MLYVFPETLRCDNREELPLSKTTRNVIRQNWTALIKFMELDSGLIYKLYATGCLRDSQREIIGEQQTAKQKKEKLLELLLRKSLAAFDAFVRCLLETQQGHVLGLLDGTAGNFMLTFYDVIICRSLRCAFRTVTACSLLPPLEI
jgi:Caspase recruitment domain